MEPSVVETLQWLEVNRDVDAVDLDEYAAVVVSANYTSVRLRWSEREDLTTANAVDVARDVPAVRLVARPYEPQQGGGRLCHGLWLLAAEPGLLAGRREVVLADVLNARALCVPPAAGTLDDRHVAADGDLVTSTSWHGADALVDTGAELVVARRYRSAAAGHTDGRTDAGPRAGTWVDLHVFDAEEHVIEKGILPLGFVGSAFGGGDVFSLSTVDHRGLGAGPGSVWSGRDARRVQHRLHCRMGRQLLTDGVNVLHQQDLPSDAVAMNPH